MKWWSCCISSVPLTTTGEAEDGLRSYQSHTEEGVWWRSYQRWNVWYNRGLWNTSVHKHTVHPPIQSYSSTIRPSVQPSVHPSVCLSNLWSEFDVSCYLKKYFCVCCVSLCWSLQDDLCFQGYLRHMASCSSPAPLTLAEQELQRLKATEVCRQNCYRACTSRCRTVTSSINVNLPQPKIMKTLFYHFMHEKHCSSFRHSNYDSPYWQMTKQSPKQMNSTAIIPSYPMLPKCTATARWSCDVQTLYTDTHTILSYNKIPIVYVAHTLGCFINHAWPFSVSFRTKLSGWVDTLRFNVLCLMRITER